jgi:hypothetical protein
LQQHAATFFEQAEDAAGAELPKFVKDEFDTFLECVAGPRLPAHARTELAAYVGAILRLRG